MTPRTVIRAHQEAGHLGIPSCLIVSCTQGRAIATLANQASLTERMRLTPPDDVTEASEFTVAASTATVFPYFRHCFARWRHESPRHAPVAAAELRRTPCGPEQGHDAGPGCAVAASQSRQLVGGQQPVVAPGGEGTMAAAVEPHPVDDLHRVRAVITARL